MRRDYYDERGERKAHLARSASPQHHAGLHLRANNHGVALETLHSPVGEGAGIRTHWTAQGSTRKGVVKTTVEVTQQSAAQDTWSSSSSPGDRGEYPHKGKWRGSHADERSGLLNSNNPLTGDLSAARQLREDLHERERQSGSGTTGRGSVTTAHDSAARQHRVDLHERERQDRKRVV